MGKNIDTEETLTSEQLAQIDFIESLAYETMAKLFEHMESEKIGIKVIAIPAWNIEWIAQIAEILTDVAIYYFDKTEMEVYPYIDTK